jgi:phosphoribosylamine-glycine ligase
MKFMQEHGVEIPAFHTFKTLDECIKFAWKAQDPFVFKTAGDVEDKSLSYVASDPADLVSFLEKKKADGLKLKGEMYLQEKIDMISELGVSAWMGKNGFLSDKFNLNFEHKKFMADDYGPSTGEQGTVTKYAKGGGKMADLLMKFEASLVKLGHIGDFDIGCGIDSSGKVWPFEFSARFGFPSTPILMACHTSDPIEWMRDAATTGKDTLTVDYQTALGVIMTRPPYPTKNEDPVSSVGYRIDGLEGVWDSVCPIGMMIDDGPTMNGSADGRPKMGRVFKTTDECVCTVTALGPDVHDVIPQVYEAIDKIKFSDRQVRNDVGKKLEQELPKLHALGFDELPQW